MSYQLRVNGHPRELFDNPEDAIARVRYWLRVEPDCEPELRDAETGQAIGPGATIDRGRKWRTRSGFSGRTLSSGAVASAMMRSSSSSVIRLGSTETCALTLIRRGLPSSRSSNAMSGGR